MAYQDKLPILKNFVETTTASYASAVDSIIYVADASIFPSIVEGADYVPCVLRREYEYREVVHVVKIDKISNALHVIRGCEKTEAQSWPSGTFIYCTLTAQAQYDILNNIWVRCRTAQGESVEVSIESENSFSLPGDWCSELEPMMALRILSGESFLETKNGIYIDTVIYGDIYDKTTITIRGASLSSPITAIEHSLSSRALSISKEVFDYREFVESVYSSLEESERICIEAADRAAASTDGGKNVPWIKETIEDILPSDADGMYYIGKPPVLPVGEELEFGHLPVADVYGCETRTLATRFSDIVNIKDFGATGDGVHDDTKAWEHWQAALERGGVGYIPSGVYLVNGIIRHFIYGCIGNGIDHVMDASVYQPEDFAGTNVDMRESAWSNHMGTIGPLIQQYNLYTGAQSWGPMIDLAFESCSDSYFDWTKFGGGVQGIQVRGSAKGLGNSHPVCIRGYMQNKLDGDGDAVAIWGRCQKEDPTGGTNNSDTCAGHFSVVNESKGDGLIMASEHWSCPGEGNGGVAQSYSIPPGSSVCQHVKAFSKYGMTYAGILIAGGNDQSYPYGMWNAISIGRTPFMHNGNMKGVEGTTAIKCTGWHYDLGYPDIGWHVGYCPNHIKMIGSYAYNVTSDLSVFKNNTDNGNAIIAINKKLGSGTATLVFQTDGTAQSDIYVEKGNPNTFYRALQSASSHHLFFCKNVSGELLGSLSVGTEAVMPGRDGAVANGWSDHRWSQVYASTGTIETSDERLKDDIRPIDESVFKAWGKVEFRQFLFKNAVAEKGSAARIHIGLIAQQVIAAFASEGLDAMRYGIVCYDKWDAQEAVTERFKVVTREETHNEDGSVKEPEEFHYENRVLTPAKEAGDCYSIRYEEALALECAYQRRELEKIKSLLEGRV